MIGLLLLSQDGVGSKEWGNRNKILFRTFRSRPWKAGLYDVGFRPRSWNSFTSVSITPESCPIYTKNFILSQFSNSSTPKKKDRWRIPGIENAEKRDGEAYGVQEEGRQVIPNPIGITWKIVCSISAKSITFSSFCSFWNLRFHSQEDDLISLFPSIA